ncbi:hypothetical protein [Rhodococcus sp. MALMAid1271]|uniref:TetR/AcrR family transcriptional regulator n=1 Tax=Rhodococcus sp. MALMAid1271 TaxID=3411744 RepID=UPI003BA2DF3F
MRTYLHERTTNLARAMAGEDAELRAALTVASIMGITIARHFLDLEPLMDVDASRMAALTDEWLGPLG